MCYVQLNSYIAVCRPESVHAINHNKYYNSQIWTNFKVI